jgi:predicted ATPase
MRKLTSFTGAQSTGKSTLLVAFKQQMLPTSDPTEYISKRSGHRWSFVDEVTRLIKRTHGVNINEQGDDDTQLLIMNQHHVNTLNHKKSDNNTMCLMDRCAMDGYVYSYYLHSHGRITDNTMNIVRYMYQYLLKDLSVVFYTDPADVSLHDDGERSVDVEFRNEIINIYDEVLYSLIDGPQIVVLSGDVESRMALMMEHLGEIVPVT